ncbi:hypothetical protein M409DRAFT_29593 [Zasmidium cellare ATCC 36951]|uniref:Nudix hydrolase domain-containing protein n=1 Tax=Zasmidium cellare ATCC 36951 TaxID=1080233 RepID=A0A6A6BYW8_ZASCE|nr:uncharacterized protein M409DRAFT_29593 [Zasmidium cellare ATCC 36951]KAF2159981.1 hypothetical protein M409DRAFT_29593 [Zasmidium cellare ATCC 36951]
MEAFDQPLSAVWTQYPQIAGIVVGAMVVRQKVDGSSLETLILRRIATDTFPLKWETPGGGADSSVDKTLTDTAIRELREETGLQAERIICPIEISDSDESRLSANRTGRASIHGTFIFTDDEGSDWAVTTFLVEVDYGRSPITIDPLEHSEYAWITEEEARNNSFSSSIGKDQRTLEFVSQPMRKTILEGFRIAAR